MRFDGISTNATIVRPQEPLNESLADRYRKKRDKVMEAGKNIRL